MTYKRVAKHVFSDIKEYVAANRPKAKKKRTSKYEDIKRETGIGEKRNNKKSNRRR